MQAEKLELDGFAQAEMSAQRLTAGVVTYWWCLPATWIPARCCCRLVHCNAAGPVCNTESREENQKGFKVGDKCRDFLCCYHRSFGQGHGQAWLLSESSRRSGAFGCGVTLDAFVSGTSVKPSSPHRAFLAHGNGRNIPTEFTVAQRQEEYWTLVFVRSLLNVFGTTLGYQQGQSVLGKAARHFLSNHECSWL